jgi:hypothetical protein
MCHTAIQNLNGCEINGQRISVALLDNFSSESSSVDIQYPAYILGNTQPYFDSFRPPEYQNYLLPHYSRSPLDDSGVINSFSSNFKPFATV